MCSLLLLIKAQIRCCCLTTFGGGISCSVGQGKNKAVTPAPSSAGPVVPGTATSAQQAHPCWWQARTPSPLASAKFAGDSKPATLTDEQLRNVTPCEVVRSALPCELADHLLHVLLHDAAMWTRGTWFMGGKKHDAPRTSSYYELSSKQASNIYNYSC